MDLHGTDPHQRRVCLVLDAMIHRRNFKDETGKIYGRLTVVCFAGHDPQGLALWSCNCECGAKNHIIRGSSLRRARRPSRSCGCQIGPSVAARSRKAPGESGFTKYITCNLKKGAKERKLPCLLTREEIRQITQRPCHYCGALPAAISRASNGHLSEEGRKRSAFVYNGIDRVDSTKGYTLENCVAACKLCNRFKSSLPIEDFLEQVTKIYNHSARHP